VVELQTPASEPIESVAPAEPSMRAPAEQTPPPAAPRARAAPTRASLSAELAALDAIAAADAANNPAQALKLLETYRNDFPHGRLELEAEVLRIDSLAQSGQPAVAARAAERFVKRHPNSVLAARVRRYLLE
jgi:hypothetical protein